LVHDVTFHRGIAPFALHERTCTRAANVSPPWFGIAPATPSVSCRMRMLAYHGGLTPPALGGSAVRTFVGETATCAIHEHSFTRAAGITPLCLLYRVCDRKPESQTIADSRNTQERRALARRGSVTLCNGVDSPRLAHASRSWCTNGRLMQHTLVVIWTRTFAGAAGVSPPWFGNALQRV